MRLTTKGRYAVTAMLDLALHESSGPVSLADVAGRQEISLSYLEQLFARLRRAGLVKSVRGPGGGYLLGRAHAAIDVAQIIDAVNETYDTVGCQGWESCERGRMCLTQTLWYQLSGRIHSYLSAITLADLMSRAEVQRVSQRQDRLGLQTPRDRAIGDIPVAALP